MRFPAFLLAAALCFGGQLSGRRAPGFSLPDSSFKRYDLQDYRGKWVLIDFTLTSCPHCKELAKTLESVKAKYGGAVQILQVVLPPDTTATVAGYIAEHGITVPVLFDQGQMAASYFQATPQKPTFDTPHLFIIDPQGTIVQDYGHTDEEKLEAPLLMKELDELLMKSDAPTKRKVKP
jgi:peroxiredoxin